VLKQGAYDEMFVNGESVFVSDYRAPTIADTGSTCFIGGPNPELAFPSCFAGALCRTQRAPTVTRVRDVVRAHP
jgi:hypothetical protein